MSYRYYFTSQNKSVWDFQRFVANIPMAMLTKWVSLRLATICRQYSHGNVNKMSQFVEVAKDDISTDLRHWVVVALWHYVIIVTVKLNFMRCLTLSYYRRIRLLFSMGVEGMVGPATVRLSGLSFLCTLYCTSFHSHSSLRTFFFYFFVLFNSICSMRVCLVKHFCMTSTFPMALLNRTCFFHELKCPCLGQCFAYRKPSIII